MYFLSSYGGCRTFCAALTTIFSEYFNLSVKLLCVLMFWVIDISFDRPQRCMVVEIITRFLYQNNTLFSLKIPKRRDFF